MKNRHATSWTEGEFEDAHFNDERLKTRVIKLVDRLSEALESLINQACLDWAETKAAYRFFRNESIDPLDILDSHIRKTVERAKQYPTVLAIQDTTYLSYTTHRKTKGLGILTIKEEHGKHHLSKGLVMHGVCRNDRGSASWNLGSKHLFPSQNIHKSSKRKQNES